MYLGPLVSNRFTLSAVPCVKVTLRVWQKLAYSMQCGKTEKKKTIRGEGGRGSHFGQGSQMWEQCPVTELSDAGFCSSFNFACIFEPHLSFSKSKYSMIVCMCLPAELHSSSHCLCLPLSFFPLLSPFLLSIHFFFFGVSWTQPLSNEAKCQPGRDKTPNS